MPPKILSKLRARLRSKRSDPESISPDDVEKFFGNLANENAELVHSIFSEIEAAELVFDIGANAGYFSKAILAQGFKGKIYLFEPVPNLHEISKQNLEAYSSQTEFFNTALGNEDGTIPLYLPHDDNIGWITAVGEKAKSNRQITAAISSTAPLIERYKPGFLKIDVEGFESFILEPLSQAVRPRYKPAIFIELGWGVSNPHWPSTVDSLRRLEAKGYRAFDPREQGREIPMDTLVAIRQTVDILLKAA